MTDQNLQQAICEYAVRLGDDSLVLGHRVSEWCSNGPFLEEDLALQNVALDLVGRARLFYTYAAELEGRGRSEDDFAYLRNEREFQNLLIFEMPRGDFAYSMTRQMLVDAFHSLFLAALAKSGDQTLAAIAAKALKETRYHLRRSHEWTLRLGDGTEESHRRMQDAVDDLWGYTHEMFDLDELETTLLQAGIAVDRAALRPQWLETVSSILNEATLQQPGDDWAVRGGRTGYHTENLGHLLTELQFVHRSLPGLQW